MATFGAIWVASIRTLPLETQSQRWSKQEVGRTNVSRRCCGRHGDTGHDVIS